MAGIREIIKITKILGIVSGRFRRIRVCKWRSVRNIYLFWLMKELWHQIK